MTLLEIVVTVKTRRGVLLGKHRRPEFCANKLLLKGNEAEAFEWMLKFLSMREADEKTVQIFKTTFQKSGWLGALREWLKVFAKLGSSINFDGALYNAKSARRTKLSNIWRRSTNNERYGTPILALNPASTHCAMILVFMNRFIESNRSEEDWALQ